jgi:hypothetical protein
MHVAATVHHSTEETYACMACKAETGVGPVAAEEGDTVARRDGNGDPIPDSPWGIPLLGDGDGEVSSPTGM